MQTNFECHQEFLETFNPARLKREPGWPDSKAIDLAFELIEEEYQELVAAVANRDMVATFDAVCDLLYVTYGFGAFFGLPVDAGFAEVHRSNMSKLGPDGKPIYRSDGKVLKGPNYSPPNLEAILGPA